MAENLPDYQFGQRGLNIVADPLTLPEGTLLKAENVEFVREGGIGGLASRAGLAPLNGSSLGAAVLSIVNIPIDTTAFGSSQSGLLVALHPSAPVSSSSWLFSNDGAAFTVPSGLASMLPAAAVETPFFSLGLVLATRLRAAVRALESVFAVNYGTDLQTLPPKLAKWDGSEASVPVDNFGFPASSAITDVLVVGGVIYLAMINNLATPACYVRVYRLSPSTGVLTQIGATLNFNVTSVEFVALAFAYGQLFLGLRTTSDPDHVYRILPDIEPTWTLDQTLTGMGEFTSIGTFNGELYVGMFLSGGLSLIRKRTSAAVWSTSFTGASNDGYIGPLVEFDSKLFAGWWRDAAPDELKVYVFDGSTWTEDEDLAATFTLNNQTRFGQAVEFGGALYWAMPKPATAPTEDGKLLKRTTAGTWTAPINATRCVTGALAVVGP